MQEDRREHASAKPRAQDIVDDWEFCVSKRDSSAFKSIQTNVDTRMMWWPGKSEDGRRWWRRAGEADVFPWAGAADTSVPLVDTFINEDAALLMQAWRRAKLECLPTEVNDTANASRTTTLLRWQIREQMTEAEAETRLLANYFLERGSAVMATIWRQQKSKGYNRVNIAEITKFSEMARMAFQQGAPMLVDGIPNEQLAELPLYIADPTYEEAAIAIGQIMWPDASASSLRKAIRELRSTGEGRLAVSYDLKNRPCLYALAINEDVFLPPEATGIDDELSVIHWRELVTEATLIERSASANWSKQWVDDLIKNQRGKMTPSLEGELTGRLSSASGYRRGSRLALDHSRMFEIIHSYRRQVDDEGVPGIYCTIWHHGSAKTAKRDNDADWYGHHDLVSYDHGQYPMTLFTRERLSRNPEESRGYGEIASTWQQGIKSEVDSRRDRASLSTVPPSYHPTSAPPHQWGPGAKIGTNIADKYGFFKGPGWDPGSKELEKTIQAMADRYFARVTETGSNRVEAAAMRQEMISCWLEGWKKVYTQTLQLDQQYLPPEVYVRVVGDEKSQPQKVSRDEIQGKFNVVVHFNMEDMDPDMREKKWAVVGEAIKIDRDASIDSTAVVATILESVDANLPSRLMRSVQHSQEQELADEKSTFAQLWAGVDVDVKIGSNYKLRLDWLQNQLMTNQSAFERYKGDETFREAIDKRTKQLSHQIEQFGANAQIGRMGA